MAYDFNQLTDKEFEELSIDLISVILQRKIERFKSGTDGGVDGRFFIDDKKEVVLQAKHYLHSGYKKLIYTLQKSELKKVEKLRPHRYIVITSLPLSRLNKEEIKKIFHPYIKSSSDIFGQEDLNDILKNNPQIEESYFKLWISSITVFNRILNKAIKERSGFELEQIKKKTKLYVQTDCHINALKKLEKNNVIIISGEPGIGKTTLAENLCLHFASKNFDLYTIEESLTEAENVYDRETKQIFYFDDFLGSNYFEAIENKRDSHVVNFINRIKNDSNKIFILTSRTNILNSGLLHSDIFFNSKLNNNEYLLSISDISKLDKAKILYNHIWFSKLDEEILDELYKNKRYRDIISHRNFNPRVIEFITDSERAAFTSLNYWDYVWDTLEHPSDIWNNCFKVQSNEYVRNLVILTVFNGGRIKESELRDSSDHLIKIEKIKNPSHTEKDFGSASQLASKSFLNRLKTDNETFYSLFNASITDYILSEYYDNKPKLINVFLSLSTVKSLENLHSLLSQQIITIDVFKSVHENLISEQHLDEKNDDYILQLMYSFKDDKKRKATILKYVNKILSDLNPSTNIYKLLHLVYIYKSHFKSLTAEYFQGIIDHYSLDQDELKIILDLIVYLKIEDQGLLNNLKKEIEFCFDYTLEEIYSDIDCNEYVNTYYDEYNNVETDYDIDGLHDKIIERLEEELFNFNNKALDLMGLSIEDFNHMIDAEKVLDEYFNLKEPYIPDFGPYHHHSDPPVKIDPIDDLFEKT